MSKFSENRQRRLSEGLCGRCGKAPYIPDSTLCTKCRVQHREYRKKRDKALCARCSEPATNGVHCHNHILSRRQSHRNLKRTIIDHYGGKCNCCGETELDFLVIDHIGEDGAQHRKMLFGEKYRHSSAGGKFYRWIINNDFPEGNLQVLCWNCNWSKRINQGVCCHQSRDK
jgi:hypothetical protein